MGNQASTLLYTRPRYVPDDAPAAQSGGADSATASSGDGADVRASAQSGWTATRPPSIPPSLSFDKIVDGGTCPPCTIRDFMNFLIYIEHSAENLQFYLWFRDYQARFSALPEAEARLAPEWTRAHADDVAAKMRRAGAEKRRRGQPGDDILRGTDFESGGGSGPPQTSIASPPFADGDSLFTTPPRITSGCGGGAVPADRESIYTASLAPPTTAGSVKADADQAYTAAGAPIPFSIQPFREEISRVIVTYLREGAKRQLNLSATERDATLHALSYTTHPSAFQLAHKSIDASLRCQAHPNFIRWSICNGNRSRVVFARGLGVFLIIASLAAAVAITLSRWPRGYRAIPAVGWLLGISTLIAAWKGMCVVLHGLHHRHIRPWELFTDAEEGEGQPEEADAEGQAEKNKGENTNKSYDSFGSANSYEEEPWVVRYEKRNIIRKIFDRETWIESPALRQIQDIIFVQSLVGGLVLSGLLVVLLELVPGGGLF